MAFDESFEKSFGDDDDRLPPPSSMFEEGLGSVAMVNEFNSNFDDDADLSVGSGGVSSPPPKRRQTLGKTLLASGCSPIKGLDDQT